MQRRKLFKNSGAVRGDGCVPAVIVPEYTLQLHYHTLSNTCSLRDILNLKHATAFARATMWLARRRVSAEGRKRKLYACGLSSISSTFVVYVASSPSVVESNPATWPLVISFVRCLLLSAGACSLPSVLYRGQTDRRTDSTQMVRRYYSLSAVPSRSFSQARLYAV